MTSGLGRGGSELQLFQLALGLTNRSWRVDVISLQATGPYRDELQASGIRLKICPLALVPAPHHVARLMRLLTATDASLVHTQAFRANLWGRVAAITARLPVVASVRATYSYLPAIYRPVERVLASRTAAIVTPAGATRDFLIQNVRVPAERVVVIPNGVNATAFSNQPAGREFRRRHGIGSEFVVLLAGRLVKQKNPVAALRSYQKLSVNWPKSVLIVAGSGPLENDLRRQAKGGSDTVRFAGELDRNGMIGAVNASDVVLLMSEFEGSPNILLEAMAASKPIVATAIGGTNDLVDNDINGLLVPPGDIDATAAALNRLASSESLRCRLGEAGRIRAYSRHSVDANIERHIALYERVINEAKV